MTIPIVNARVNSTMPENVGLILLLQCSVGKRVHLGKRIIL